VPEKFDFSHVNLRLMLIKKEAAKVVLTELGALTQLSPGQ
tara:strand:- start:1103 stop:1222 length:120 start_codon:yes stop_codon:yes gene_type:complete